MLYVWIKKENQYKNKKFKKAKEMLMVLIDLEYYVRRKSDDLKNFEIELLKCEDIFKKSIENEGISFE